MAVRVAARHLKERNIEPEAVLTPVRQKSLKSPSVELLLGHFRATALAGAALVGSAPFPLPPVDPAHLCAGVGERVIFVLTKGAACCMGVFSPLPTTSWTSSATDCFMVSAWAFNSSAADAHSSALAAFPWVTLSIWPTAELIWEMPWVCSFTAAAIESTAVPT